MIGLMVFLLGLALGLTVSPWFFFLAGFPIFIEIAFQSDKAYRGIKLSRRRRKKGMRP